MADWCVLLVYHVGHGRYSPTFSGQECIASSLQISSIQFSLSATCSPCPRPLGSLWEREKKARDRLHWSCKVASRLRCEN